jgi:hypothetical protein
MADSRLYGLTQVAFATDRRIMHDKSGDAAAGQNTVAALETYLNASSGPLVLTRAAYDALSQPRASRLYLTSDTKEIFYGDEGYLLTDTSGGLFAAEFDFVNRAYTNGPDTVLEADAFDFTRSTVEYAAAGEDTPPSTETAINTPTFATGLVFQRGTVNKLANPKLTGGTQPQTGITLTTATGLPTGWGKTGAGFTHSITTPATQVTISGGNALVHTITAQRGAESNGFPTFSLEAFPGPVPGTSTRGGWCLSMHVKITAMSGAATGIRFYMEELDGANANVGADTMGTTYSTLNTWKRLKAFRPTLANVANKLFMRFQIMLAGNTPTGAFSITVQVTEPQLEDAANERDATSWHPGTRATPAITLNPPGGTFDVLRIRDAGVTFSVSEAVTEANLALSPYPTIGYQRLRQTRLYPAGTMSNVQREAQIDLHAPIALDPGIPDETNLTLMGKTFISHCNGLPHSMRKANNRFADYMRYELRAGDVWVGDPNQTHRTESVQVSGRMAPETLYSGFFWLMIEPGLAMNGTWCVFNQIKEQPGAGSPPYDLGYYTNGELRWNRRGLNFTDELGPMWTTVPARGVWYPIIHEYKISHTLNGGSFTIYFDGVQRFRNTALTIGQSGSTEYYWTNGVYMAPNGTNTVTAHVACMRYAAGSLAATGYDAYITNPPSRG